MTGFSRLCLPSPSPPLPSVLRLVKVFEITRLWGPGGVAPRTRSRSRVWLFFGGHGSACWVSGLGSVLYCTVLYWMAGLVQVLLMAILPQDVLLTTTGSFIYSFIHKCPTPSLVRRCLRLNAWKKRRKESALLPVLLLFCLCWLCCACCDEKAPLPASLGALSCSCFFLFLHPTRLCALTPLLDGAAPPRPPSSSSIHQPAQPASRGCNLTLPPIRGVGFWTTMDDLPRSAGEESGA